MPPFTGSRRARPRLPRRRRCARPVGDRPGERDSRHRRLPDRAHRHRRGSPARVLEISRTPSDSDCVGKRAAGGPDHRRERCRPLPPALLRRDRHGGQAVRRQRRAVRDADRHCTSLGCVHLGCGTRGRRPGRGPGGPISASPWPALRSRSTAPRSPPPTGVEMMAALALWMSLIGLLLARPSTSAATGGQRAVCRRRAGDSAAARPAVVPRDPRCGAVAGVRAQPGRVRALLRRPAVLAGGLVVLLSACAGHGMGSCHGRPEDG